MAVAASMLTAAYYMLRNDMPYTDRGADHLDQRDKRQVANRLIKRLASLGFTVEVTAAA
jgi:hypothetical protein